MSTTIDHRGLFDKPFLTFSLNESKKELTRLIATTASEILAGRFVSFLLDHEPYDVNEDDSRIGVSRPLRIRPFELITDGRHPLINHEQRSRTLQQQEEGRLR